MNRTTEEKIRAVAQRQHGVVTRAQLIEAGMSPWTVKRRARAGLLRRLHRGVYLTGPLAPPHAAAMAAVLACGSDAVLSHGAAAVLWELWEPPRSNATEAGKGRGSRPPGKRGTPWSPATPRRYPEPIDITVEGGGRSRAGIRVHRAARIARDERTIRHGIPVTTPGRTLVDLAGRLRRRELEQAVARAERATLVDVDGLSRFLERHRRRAGVARLRTILEAPGESALTRSQAEEEFLALVRRAGLPSPRTNVRLGPYEIDFLWEVGIAAEVDGFGYHASRPQFEHDRRKDAWLLAQGIQVIRLSWRQIVYEGVATAVQVGQAIARAGT